MRIDYSRLNLKCVTIYPPPLRLKKFSQKIFKKGIDKRVKNVILKVQKENNLQKMLGTNINTRSKLYEIQVAPKGGHG